MELKLSILDQTPIRRDSTAKEALQESIQLAKFVDTLGFTRYWISEHHNIKTLAGAAPEVLLRDWPAKQSTSGLDLAELCYPITVP